MRKLVISTYAYAKLRFIADIGPTEVAFMGISEEDDPFYIVDFIMAPQVAEPAHVKFNAGAVLGRAGQLYAADPKLKLARSDRIWVHTHPSGVNGPSGTDENTFAEVYAKYAWAIMLIVTLEGKHYARLRTNVTDFKNGAGDVVSIQSSEMMEVVIDYKNFLNALDLFDGDEEERWTKEYKENVTIKEVRTSYPFLPGSLSLGSLNGLSHGKYRKPGGTAASATAATKATRKSLESFSSLSMDDDTGFSDDPKPEKKSDVSTADERYSGYWPGDEDTAAWDAWEERRNDEMQAEVIAEDDADSDSPHLLELLEEDFRLADADEAGYFEAIDLNVKDVNPADWSDYCAADADKDYQKAFARGFEQGCDEIREEAKSLAAYQELTKGEDISAADDEDDASLLTVPARRYTFDTADYWGGLGGLYDDDDDQTGFSDD